MAPIKICLTIYESLKNSYLKGFGTMSKKRFSQPQSKGSPMQRQTARGLKLVYSLINFVIPLPSIYTRHSQRNCGRLPKCMVNQIKRFVRYFSKKIAEELPR